MLTNAYLLAKIGADTAENEQHLAEILPIGRCVADRRRTPSPRARSARARRLRLVEAPLHVRTPLVGRLSKAGLSLL